MAKQPNILFLMADQMAAPLLSCYGGQGVKTPHLDQLAKEGVVFDSAYTASPLCAPSRYTLMAGSLPTRIGAWDNAAEFAADIPTFAHYLRDSGYKTCLSGKMHFCGPDQLHGFEQRLTSDIYPADYGWFPDWEDFDQRPTWYHNMSSVTQAGTCFRSNQLDFDDEVIFHAERWLYERARSGTDQPFCLTVSMTHPHDPYAALPEYWDRYEDVDIPMPNHQLRAKDPHSERLRHVIDHREALPEEAIYRARRAYFANISYVDDQIGRVLKALEDSGQAEDTIIIFSGDHGDMLGERDLWYKMSWFEMSSRVPLIIHAPARFQPHHVPSSVSTIDLLPTFIEMAGGNVEDTLAVPIDGRSLMPHLQGEEGHDEVIGEYCGEGAIAPLFMIRRGRYKYVTSAVDPEQLFDVQNDPEEVVNLAESSEHQALMAAMRAEAAERWCSDTIREQVIASQKRRRLVARALMKGERTPWDHQPMVDASRQYMRNTIDLDDLEAMSRFPRVN